MGDGQQHHVLLTGVSGFIAKHCALQLLNAGHRVRGTLRTPARSAEVTAALRPHLARPELAGNLEFAALDLTRDDGWDAAMAGITAVMHTASPFPIVQPGNPDDLIRPAVDGTLRALRAARAAGVTRVILTSSVVAVTDDGVSGPRDETDWCDPDRPASTAYARSKTLAERAAWDFATAQGMALTTINPGLVLGPPLDGQYGSSVGLVKRMLSGRDPMMPDLGFAIVDVRDVARMHLRALERPDTAGKRYLAVAGHMRMPGMGRALKARFPARRIPTRTAPSMIVRALSLFDPAIRSILPQLGQTTTFANARARADMAMDFIAPEAALAASADWLVTHEG